MLHVYWLEDWGAFSSPELASDGTAIPVSFQYIILSLQYAIALLNIGWQSIAGGCSLLRLFGVLFAGGLGGLVCSALIVGASLCALASCSLLTDKHASWFHALVTQHGC